jgi:hypothetical protein
MNTHKLIQISGMILLAVAISLVMLTLVYAVQHPQLLSMIATVSWNG